MQWTNKELDLIKLYFNKNLSELSLFKKITDINPNRTYGAVLRKIYDFKEQGFDKKPHLAKLRVGYLDIEASNLNASFGMMLSWYIKVKGQNKYYYSVITKKEIFAGVSDKRLVKELLSAFNNFDILYTHYGSIGRFDVPFIITRAFKHNLEQLLPKYMEKFVCDTYDIAKKKLRLHSNRLDAIAEALNITNVKKTPLSASKWTLAMIGCPKELEYILKHNRHDVILLERIHQKLAIVENPVISRYRSI